MSGSPHDFAADAFHAGQLYVWCTCTCLMKDTLPPKRSITAVKPLR